MERILTIDGLIQGLQTLGVKKGMTLLVHSSLSSFGCYVCGAEIAVIQALCRSVGKQGTIMMPTHSSTYSDPMYWQNPPVASQWWDTIRAMMPAFCPDTAPVIGVGSIPAHFVKMKETKRSVHPMTSFAAWGKYASLLVNHHPLEYGLGEHSPLARLLDIKGYVLFLGAPYESNTMLHLSEIRANYPTKRHQKQGAPIVKGKKRMWVEFDEIDYDNDDFDMITREYCLQSLLVNHTKIEQAHCTLMPAAELVEFGRRWIEKHRI